MRATINARRVAASWQPASNGRRPDLARDSNIGLATEAASLEFDSSLSILTEPARAAHGSRFSRAKARGLRSRARRSCAPYGSPSGGSEARGTGGGSERAAQATPPPPQLGILAAPVGWRDPNDGHARAATGGSACPA